MSRDGGYDRFLTIFSPEGRLYQIEYATKAVSSSGVTAVGVRGSNSVVLACQKKIPDKMIDPSSVTKLFNITPKVGAVVVGFIADGHATIQRTRQEAAEFHYKNGYPMPASIMAKRVADLAQINTQHAGRRTMGTDIMLVSVDDEMGPQLFKIDPSGHYFGYKAISAGALAQEANSLLEKKVKENENMSLDEAIRAAMMTLQSSIGTDFKQNEIEVAIVADEYGEFTRLSEEEIEGHLTAIAERD
mmetsp:Transcript_15417/g.19086  ORF Transcript_15417/g.19086 Transcript_15417/m.19086 type:complete len:245 (+) Transcript_15417:133-867(+)|eukprot:CAMPEP_0204825560 /NCGR_PEP_ID=MMETSP1346-20131115/3427_1 /ASSEMBLY_ACC=CAM_ASM_000771 /TAXON_ID=215587 /ORGANISM="Aplanochytrium stocchinoi, Strain GSBS06" /LENGTH=244 /DNA_ID=CAMNT_0051953231 /DNA_START=447 /DNA_END=1181 /DNA_ORIENTATION=+